MYLILLLVLISGTNAVEVCHGRELNINCLFTYTPDTLTEIYYARDDKSVPIRLIGITYRDIRQQINMSSIFEYKNSMITNTDISYAAGYVMDGYSADENFFQYQGLRIYRVKQRHAGIYTCRDQKSVNIGEERRIEITVNSNDNCNIKADSDCRNKVTKECENKLIECNDIKIGCVLAPIVVKLPPIRVIKPLTNVYYIPIANKSSQLSQSFRVTYSMFWFIILLLIFYRNLNY